MRIVCCSIAVGLILGGSGCSSPLPEPRGISTPTEITIPDFSGGPQGPEIEKKKAALVTEYEQLAQAEEQLDRDKMALMTREAGDSFGGAYGRSTRATQKVFLAKSYQRINQHQERIEVLRRELTNNGVTITTHR